MDDFVKVSFINKITRIIETKDSKLNDKSKIIKNVVSDIIKLKQTNTGKKKKQDNDRELTEIFLFDHDPSNAMMSQLLIWLIDNLNETMFLDTLKRLEKQNGSAFQSIRCFFNKTTLRFEFCLKT